MTNLEQLIQELEQAPDDLVKAILDLFHQVQAIRRKYPLATFSGILSQSEPDLKLEIKVIPSSEQHDKPSNQLTLASFVGTLHSSPNFQEDPVVIQRQMRDEWT